VKPSLSPKELALAIDASESSIKRWVDKGDIKADLTGGGHRRIYSDEAIRFIRERQPDIKSGGVIGFPDVDSVLSGAYHSDQCEEYLYGYLTEGQAEKSSWSCITRIS
jgi:hypothetical protein